MEDEASETLETSVESQTIMNVFGAIQNGIVFVTLLIGIIVLMKLMINRCRNLPTLVLIVISGLFHLSYCVLILRYVKRSVFDQSHHGCLDFYPVTIVSNAVILLAITFSVMTVNEEDTKQKQTVNKFLLILQTFLSVGLLLYLTFVRENHLDYAQPPALKIVKTVNVFFTVCQKNISSEAFTYVMEYILFYMPFIWILTGAIRSNYEKYEDFKLQRIQILRTCCHDFKTAESCRCLRLNSVLQVFLVYYGLCLLVIRPFMIIYSLANGESYRDILPSLTNTVLFVLLCIEYLNSDAKSERKTSPTSDSEKYDPIDLVLVVESNTDKNCYKSKI